MKYRLAAFADEVSSSVRGQIKAMKENGIEMLEIRGVDGTNIADITKEKAAEVRSMLDDAGITVWSLGSPYGKIDLRDDFEKHLDSFRHGLELADILGAGRIRLFSFYGAKNETDEVTERLGRFIDAASGTGLLLCHENEKGIYGETARECLTLHKSLPSIKAVFDPANFIQCGQETKEAWDMLEPCIEYMHIKDALPDGTVVPAGKGVGDLPFLLGRYQGEVLTIEPHLGVFEGFDKLESSEKSKMCEYTYPTPEAAFKAAADALRALI